ncbi:PucR family transcriptional regulator [Ruminococcus sp. CLA-AA-H200]|uniref:PucR family transcriptional regulator n=1 Tax=Ruminococcus turbiniformis TaxID=2881258 RepID=A0ABS8FXJ6_9FIRM|nr:PucR family transcriptional regulator [Ruminococcus turbiniformis]MCC2254775.1 PucR family transcriptional regulator [Ruminococcus turbiniformis]
MNQITVSDILNLDIMKGARIAAGKSGLSREVRYVNVYDNPFSESDQNVALFPNDVYLSFLYYGQDNPEYLDYFFRLLVKSSASALIVFDEYFKELPEEMTRQFDRAGLPLIFIDYRTPYSLIISAIIEYHVHVEQRKSIEDKLTAIAGHTISDSEKRQLISSLNPNFQKNITVLFAFDRASGSDSGMRLHNLCTAVVHDLRFYAAEYRKGVLVILSCSDSRLPEMESSVRSMTNLIRQYLPGASVGISDTCPLSALGTAISQSYSALVSGMASAGSAAYYRQLGVARILVDLEGSPALEAFYRDITDPLLQFDQETGGCLFDTLLRFAEHDMDYKKTAAAMSVHENTIRYRMNKIKELTPFGISDTDFYETVSVTFKIHRMKTFG